MKAGKYNIKDLFVNRYLQKIIIPEIQRDYVWGRTQVLGLFQSILNDYKKFTEALSPVILETDKDLEEDFFNFYKRRKYASNIGFIYAYNDATYEGKYFLIDGQQRITTVYLLALVLVNRNSELVEHFKRTFLFLDSSKLDYKVRDAAHEFLSKLTSHFIAGKNHISQQNWHYDIYNNDKTICSITSNIEYLSEELNKVKDSINEKDFYSYLCDYVEFWYFDTNISEQGEELYIYMNARGEQMQSNENIKADLLGSLDSDDEKNNYGKKWEQWQDFFWQHRRYKEKANLKQNENADKGFNEFLSCIGGLENFIKGNSEHFYSKEKFESANKIETTDILTSITLEKVQAYVWALEYIEKNKESFKQCYNYSDWVDDCIAEIWQLFNKETTNWFANFNDANRATERNRMVFVWSVLYFITQKGKDEIDYTEVFRLLRMFYLRYNNFNRSVSTLLKTVDLIGINGVFDSLENEVIGELDENGTILTPISGDETDTSPRTTEEKIKLHILKAYLNQPFDQREFEEVIWQIEDHKFNLNGKDVGATNISHLVKVDGLTSIETLKLVRDKFYEIFPESQTDYLAVQNGLLYFGPYWYRTGPDYYFNYQFDNWRRIIRGYGEKNSFELFFQSFCEFHGSLEQFLNEIESNYNADENITINDFNKQLIWYNQQLRNKMWGKGNFIALREWVNHDKIFPNQLKIFNTQGDFRGYNNVELFNLLPEELKEQFEETTKINSHDQPN